MLKRIKHDLTNSEFTNPTLEDRCLREKGSLNKTEAVVNFFRKQIKHLYRYKTRNHSAYL